MSALTMQEVLLRLQSYWTEQGCLTIQPFNTEVGAGTANPATALRVLGPEPWRVAYVEPSVRPDDARYGENPNRLQTHTQFQVILKPDPGNPQELYLGSLQALGVDIEANDIRFVEDNWTSPALGAWGLGWEVWLNGLEITQFTYFQQAGGLTLDPVSVEITYGLERIVMALQNVSHFKDIRYTEDITYGEVFGQAEYEMSRYYLDDADIETNRNLFDAYAAEATRMLDLGLPVPAYTYILKCSHTFNVLDARGAISTTERATSFTQMRGLTRRAAELWAARREELGHPLGTVEPLAAAQPSGGSGESSEPAPLLFEIGVEELPAHEVARAAAAVRDAVADKLGRTNLEFGAVAGHATPRRIVITVDAVAPREPDTQRFVRGPKVEAAYAEDGSLTPAAQGFARKNGVDADGLVTREINGATHIGVESTVPGRSAHEALSSLLAEVVGELRAEKNMRWRDPKLSYSRPIRWLLALLGDTHIDVAVSALAGGGSTRVHRWADQPEIPVARANGYLDLLQEHGIVANRDARRASVVAQAEELAASVGGVVDLDADAALVEEITDLVEAPNAILGGFDPRFLELPDAILMTVMRKHQRYLPVRSASGELLPHFVAVANGPCDADLVRSGYEAVLTARYEDAAFFWRADLSVPLETHKAGLTKLTFADKLGSVAERADRIAAIAAALGGRVELTGDESSTLDRAASLAKFDLASQMVIELSSLAGTIAREYALRAGESAAVADALAEMEMPRTSADAPPETIPGALLALADRFDLLVGLFAIGANPTGSSDPFGLRRASLGLVTILRTDPRLRTITLGDGIAAAAAALRTQGIDVPSDALDAAFEFVARRFEQQLVEQGFDHKAVAAVRPSLSRPGVAGAVLATLTERHDDEQFRDLVRALQRVARIAPETASDEVSTDLLTEPAEQELLAAVDVAAARVTSESPIEDVLAAATGLVAPIDRFFTDVLVMAEDPAVRAARLALLGRIRSLTSAQVDWTAL